MKSKAFVLLLIPLAGLLSAQPGEVGPSSAPQIAELSGLVTRYDEKSASFIPVRIGEPISEPTLLLTAAGAELMIAPRSGEDTIKLKSRTWEEALDFYPLINDDN